MKKFFLFFSTFIVLMCGIAGAASLDAIKEAYLYGDTNEALRLGLAALNENPTDETLYFVALSYSKLGQYEKAREHFRLLLKHHKDSIHHDAAIVKLVDTYFLQKNLEKAEALYRSIIARYPSLEYLPLVYLRMAQIAAKCGDWQRKNHYLAIIREEYPRSTEAKLALRLARRGDFFTVQVGAFSSKKNAAGFMKKLRKSYPAYIIEEASPEITFYKVRVGKYKTRREAEQISEELHNKGYPARIYP